MQILADGQNAFQAFLDSGYPYRDCITDDIVSRNISNLPNISILNPTHRTRAGEMTTYKLHQGILKMLEHRYNTDKLTNHFAAAKGNPQYSFKVFATFLDKELMSYNLGQVVHDFGVHMVDYMSDHLRIIPKYFQYFCQSRSIDLVNPINPKKINDLFKEYLSKIKSIVDGYAASDRSIFSDPKKCHLASKSEHEKALQDSIDLMCSLRAKLSKKTSGDEEICDESGRPITLAISSMDLFPGDSAFEKEFTKFMSVLEEVNPDLLVLLGDGASSEA